ncbi:hypothetical protein BDR26DRAFT_856418 [Obelidium mucronatum]|nr:hypothetical protein BDR26DRAFT_856418 [Obelidium mucronatum]
MRSLACLVALAYSLTIAVNSLPIPFNKAGTIENAHWINKRATVEEAHNAEVIPDPAVLHQSASGNPYTTREPVAVQNNTAGTRPDETRAYMNKTQAALKFRDARLKRRAQPAPPASVHVLYRPPQAADVYSTNTTQSPAPMR